MKQNSKLSDSHTKLKNAECEIKTLKSFLVHKTATVEKKKMEIQEVSLNCKTKTDSLNCLFYS